MQHTPDSHHRRSIRLKGYDYAGEGWYFITICTRNYRHLFGKIENGAMMANEAGRMAAETLLWLPRQYEYVHLAEWIVMPNHLHAIIVIDDAGGDLGMDGGDCRGGSCRGGSRTAPTRSVRMFPPYHQYANDPCAAPRHWNKP